MIYKLAFEDGHTDWCTGKDLVHLLKSYDAELGLRIQDIESIEKISEEASKSIMARNSEYDEDHPDEMPKELYLLELAIGNDFSVIASTEFI